MSEMAAFRHIIRSHCKNIGISHVEQAATGDQALQTMVNWGITETRETKDTGETSIVVVHDLVGAEPIGARFAKALKKVRARFPNSGFVPVVIVFDGEVTVRTIHAFADAGANYLLRMPISAQGLMKGMHIALTQPNAFRERANKLEPA
ncbi:MAG: hypothetical protein HN403_05695 [Rhodospirillales bacterium]|nr:hypothetical protein [Rhodospirillales bacterium]